MLKEIFILSINVLVIKKTDFSTTTPPSESNHQLLLLMLNFS